MSSQRYISDTLKKKKKNQKKIKAYLIVIAVLVIIGGLIYLTRLPQAHINNVQISGNTFVSTDEIQSKADEVLNSTYIYLIPKRNIFVFPKSELFSKIKTNPAVIDVRLNKNFFDTLQIEITEQAKEALYCNSWERTECFYINEQGYIYANASGPIVQESEMIIYVEGEQKNIQDYVDDEELYKNIITFIKSSIRQGIPVINAYIKTDGIVEFNTVGGTKILTSRYDDFQKDFLNFIVLFDQNVLIKEELSNVDYIDVRFGNKVFYKNKTN